MSLLPTNVSSLSSTGDTQSDSSFAFPFKKTISSCKMQIHLTSHSGKGREEVEREKKEGSPSNTKLCLGYGVEEKEASVNAKSVFTSAQLLELQLQAVVFKYIISGLPIPFHLFFTIWNSVSTSLGSAAGGIYKLYPSLGRFDYTSMMDPEPGRCRRTDGKKWRCKSDVIPDQKYCERHVHRGRNRSRKPVEASNYVTKSDDTSVTSKRTKLYASPDDPGSNFASPSTVKTASLFSTSRDLSAKPSEKHDNHMTCYQKNTTADLCLITGDRSNNADSKNIGFNHISPRKNKKNKNYEDPRNYDGLVPGFGISAKSDLQLTTETEPQRCRRSDGKKWRCSRSVVPQQKYCETHMHRGAKKPSSDRFSHQTISKNDDDGRNLNTRLSISTLPGPQNIAEDDSNSNSTSDATTITDEIPAFVLH